MQHQWQRCAPMQAHQCVRGQWTCGRARPPAPRVRSTTRRLCKAAEGDDGPAAGPSIIVYSKQECPLCVGLEEKVQALIARAQFMPSALTGASLEVRDVSERAEWQAQYAGQVPVLVVLDPEGNEVVVPRPPPRTPTDRLQRLIEQALAQAAGSAGS